MSYPPYIIKRWCRKVINDQFSSNDEKIEASELLFTYFINNMIQPNPRNLYLICHDKRSPEKLILIKDTRNHNKEYIISANGKEIKYRLSNEEFNLIKNILGDLQIDNFIEEYRDSFN